ncbi:MAG: type 1 glutamine amidotransferase [Candidatus Levybacteria bacterium]|nr:type 1 glutamine amidotransferase [Candidatus Levybacteria bacterium]
MKKYSLTIGWLYPELMSTYGDRGNIIVFKKRCEWRGIKTETIRLDAGFSVDDLKNCDLLFMGGAQDRQQQIVAKDLVKKRKALKQMIDNGTPGLYICGAYQFLGKYYREADGTVINGLGILDLYTENPGKGSSRLIGNVAAQVLNNGLIMGFENHGGRTYLGKNVKPLGKVIKGFGNNGKDQTEGAIYKNSFGSYFHGPMLPKNPEFADFLIKLALEKKYSSPINLSPLPDSLEIKARESIANRLGIDL